MKSIAFLLGVSLIICATDACTHEGNLFKPHPGDCRLYYSVVEGVHYEISCPDKMFFDDDKCLCDWEENVKSCKIIACDASKVYYTESETSCTDYYLCYYGRPLKYTCYKGFEFHDELKQCIPRKDSKCLKLNCPAEDKNGTLTFLPGRECNEYYVCVKGKPVQQKCANDLHWAVDRDRCEQKETAECDGDIEIDPAMIKTIDHPVTTSIDCPTNLFALLPSPTECEFFFGCDNGISTLIPCLKGLAFDKTTRDCVLRKNVQCPN